MSAVLVLAVMAATPLTLEEVKAQSRNQLDAIRAELNLRQAQEQVNVARSGIIPQLQLGANVGGTFAGPQRIFSTVPQDDGMGGVRFVQTAVDTPGFAQGRYNLSLTLSQLIYDGGRWWNRIAQAGLQEQAAEGQLAEQRLASELEATSRFYELLRSQVSLKVLEATVARSREQVDRARALYEAGRGQRSAVYDAMTNLANDEINVLRQRQRIVQARLALLSWLARPDEDVEAVSPPGLDQPPPVAPVDRAIEQARERRPLVRALARQVDAAEKGVWVASGAYWPTISASATYFRSSPTPDPFFTDLTRQNAVQLGANLTWNLFDGLNTPAQVALARVELQRAAAQEKQSLVDLENELKRTHQAVSTELAVLTVASSSLKIAAEQLALEEERFAAGAGSSLEVRNAQVKLTQAELQVVSGQADVAVAKAALERTAGGAL